jgi:glycerol uptake facilitator-like aquaporin
VLCVLEEVVDIQRGGRDMPLWQRAAAELVGTFWLVLGGCGSAVLDAAFPGLGIGHQGVALAFGLTVLTWPSPSGTYRAVT